MTPPPQMPLPMAPFMPTPPPPIGPPPPEPKPPAWTPPPRHSATPVGAALNPKSAAAASVAGPAPAAPKQAPEAAPKAPVAAKQAPEAAPKPPAAPKQAPEAAPKPPAAPKQAPEAAPKQPAAAAAPSASQQGSRKRVWTRSEASGPTAASVPNAAMPRAQQSANVWHRTPDTAVGGASQQPQRPALSRFQYHRLPSQVVKSVVATLPASLRASLNKVAQSKRDLRQASQLTASGPLVR